MIKNVYNPKLIFSEYRKYLILFFTVLFCFLVVPFVSYAAKPTTFTTWTVSPLTASYGTTVNASWSANNSPTSYSIIVNGVETPVGMSTTWSGKPTPGDYNVSIKACNSGGCLLSDSKMLKVLEDKPTNSWLSLSVTSVAPTGEFTATWSGNNTPSSYKMMINSNVYDVGPATSWTGTPDSLVPKLVTGVNKISVQACNSGGCSDWSPSKILEVIDSGSITVVPGGKAPTISYISVNPNKLSLKGNFTATWSGNNTPSSYVLRFNGKEVSMGALTSWTGTPESLGLVKDTVYSVASKACNIHGCSDWSAIETIEVIVSSEIAPTTSSVDLIQYPPYTSVLDNFTANWSGNNSPTSYNIKVNSVVYDMGSADTWTGTPTSFALPAGTHYVSVQACNSGGCSDWSPSKKLVITSALPTPGKAKVNVNPKSVATNENFTATWSGDTHSYYYNALVDSTLYNAGMYFGVTNTWTGTPESLGLYPGKHHIYFQACNTGGCGEWSDPAELTVTSPVVGKPTLSSFDVGPSSVPVSGTFTATWSGNNTPTYYNIMLDKKVIYPVVSAVSWTGTPAMLGWGADLHTISVQACNLAGCSDWSDDKIINVTGSATGVAPTSADINIVLSSDYVLTPINGFCANWSGNNSPTNYNIKVDSKVYIMGSETNWCGTPSQLGLADGSYSVSVQACNASGCGPWSSIKPLVVHPIATPPTISNIWVDKPNVTATDTITVEWDGNNVPNSYHVMVDSLIYNVGAGTNWKGTPEAIGLGVGVNTLRSRACNSGGCSPWSNPVTVSYTPSSVVVNSPTLSFTANPTTVSYGNVTRLEWNATNVTDCTASGGWGGLKGINGSTDSSPITANTTFTLDCNGPFGNISKSVTVILGVSPLPDGSIEADDCTITIPGTRTCSTTVRWNSNGYLDVKVDKRGAVWLSLDRPEDIVSSRVTSIDYGGTNFTLRSSHLASPIDSVVVYARCDTSLVETYNATTKVYTCESSSVPVVSTTIPPTIEITAEPSLIRKSQTADIKIDITSDENVTCNVYGVDDHVKEFNHKPNSSSNVTLKEYTTRELTSTQIIKVKCTVDDEPSVSAEAEYRINVVATGGEV
ncbi:MAG: hypothetical protein UZ19_OD1000327 [Parcubacteria bacterium OLB19]|nr:MAG: hypothetical protein UZ19_OD1000327 [Parcubacteria bacterium OLB19]